jgi:hypothetical protein
MSIVHSATQGIGGSHTITDRRTNHDAASPVEVPAFIVAHEVVTSSGYPDRSITATESRRADTAPESTVLSRLGKSSNQMLTPVIPIPRRLVPRQRTQVMQQWEGTVVEVSSNSFGARLQSLTTAEEPEEWATLQMDDVTEDERHLIQPGGVFYWSVGYLIEPHGQRRTASTIYFRRLPRWTDRELETASRAADAYRDFLLDPSE